MTRCLQVNVNEVIIGELVLCNCTESAEDDKMRTRRGKADVKKQLLKSRVGTWVNRRPLLFAPAQPTALFFRQSSCPNLALQDP